MPGLMEYLDSINSTKVDIMGEGEENSYPAFQVNRGMAQHIDTIMIAQEMNKLAGLPNRMQYDLYLNMVSKKKRYGKWVKSVATPEDIEFVANHYKISITKAEEYIALLTPEQLEEMKSNYFEGGSNKVVDKKKKTA